ncbi:MAG: hypothetical protein JO219_01070 [Candidatus Eremiobacteraeota bacterium]|nr:hypothetical protein [Candidatus Eremiobacteraeota bacterium]MBV8365687.1 hypothetical protein [Candidatus Eremiobacteraeota bacterium]
MTVHVATNPIPHATSYFTPNPLTTQNNYQGFLETQIGMSAPPGDYDVTMTIAVTATAKPPNFGTQHNCIVIATPPIVSITNVNVASAPVVSVIASPTATNGEFQIYTIGQAVVSMPRPTDEPVISANTGVIYESNTFEPGGARNFLFTFMQNTPAPSGQPALIAPGRYTQVQTYWDNYGSYHDPKVSTTSTPMPCYSLSNDVINQSLRDNPATMSLAVQLQATATPAAVKPIVLYYNTPDPRYPGIDGFAYIQGTMYPTDALLYIYYGPIPPSNLSEVIFHELDHFYYSGPTNGVFPAQLCQGTVPCAASSTLMLGGKPTTFLWNLLPVQMTASNGYDDFIHLLIHNDLISGFNSDKTGALNEAFDQVSPPPSPAGVFPVPNANQWSQIQAAYANQKISWNWATPTPAPGFTPSPLPMPTPTPVPPPPKGLTCGSAPHIATNAIRPRVPNSVKAWTRPDPVQ